MVEQPLLCVMCTRKEERVSLIPVFLLFSPQITSWQMQDFPGKSHCTSGSCPGPHPHSPCFWGVWKDLRLSHLQTSQVALPHLNTHPAGLQCWLCLKGKSQLIVLPSVCVCVCVFSLFDRTSLFASQMGPEKGVNNKHSDINQTWTMRLTLLAPASVNKALSCSSYDRSELPRLRKSLKHTKHAGDNDKNGRGFSD